MRCDECIHLPNIYQRLKIWRQNHSPCVQGAHSPVSQVEQQKDAEWEHTQEGTASSLRWSLEVFRPGVILEIDFF